MPNLYTHYFTGLATLKKLPDKLVKAIDYSAYQFGLQGPDFFFYYNTAPIRPNVRVPALGSAIHRRNVGEFFSACIDFIKTQKGERYRLAASYFAGFLCHYALDTAAHPYVYYYAARSTSYHALLETMMDVQLLTIYGETRFGLPAHELVKPGKSKSCVAEMYTYAIQRAHDLRINKKIPIKAMESFSQFCRKLNDPEGKIYQRNKTFEMLLLRGFPLVSRALHPPEYNGKDYLNLEHKLWRKPWDYDFTSTQSVTELMEVAAQKSSEYIIAFDNALADSTNIPAVLNIFGQNSFLTGENWRFKHKSLYYGNMFE